VEIYDKQGRLIGYVNPAHISKAPLDETRQAGERKREEWLRDLARRSHKENWDAEKASVVVEQEIAATPNLRSGATAAKSEGLIACNPAVRSDFDRLQRLRNDAWELDSSFFRRVKHGPSQLLIDVLRRQSKASERQHVATVQAYLDFMHKKYL
jgi:hypothetical protein